MNDSILIIGEDERYCRKLFGLLCNIANISIYSLENCDLVEQHLSTHKESAILLQLEPDLAAVLMRINDINPHIPVALYGENVTYSQTRFGFQHGVTDVLDIRSITIDEVCKTIEHMLDPYTSGANNRLLPQSSRFQILISRGQHFEQQLQSGRPPAYYMNGNRAVLLRANVRCRDPRAVVEHNVLLDWINEFGITNTFCFSKQYGQIRLGAIVEQDYINPNAFRHALNERLEGFFQNMETLNCVAAAATISSDFLSEGVFNHINELVCSVFYMENSGILRDEIRPHAYAPDAALTALYSAAALNDAAECEAQLDAIFAHLRRDMPEVGLARSMLAELLWNCAVILGKRGRMQFKSTFVAFDSLEAFRELFEKAVLQLLLDARQEAPLTPLAEVIARISDNPGRPISIDQAAAELNFSRSHFCRLFRKETGKSFTEFLTVKRIEKACDLFRHTHMSTADVAGLVGFKTAYYFKQTFRKEMGMDVEVWKEENCK